MRLESEFYNSVSVTFINKEKAEYAILFSQYGTSKELNENKDGYPILRLNEFSTSFISEPSKYCCLLDNDTYQTLRLKKDDVLICRTNGNPKLVGKSAIVPKDYDYAFASYLFRVRPKKEIINSATLVAFLNCKYGRMEIEKYSMVGNQANFSPAKFREISIPILGLNINNKIENMTHLSFDKFEQSKSFYSEAEKCLLECLGMKDFVANPNTINAQSLKDSFLKTGRLDAEYYQPKYDELFALLGAYDTKTLSEIVNIEKSIEPGSEAYQTDGIPFIRVANLSKFGITDTDVYLSAEEYSDIIRPEKDTILLSKDGSVGIAYKVEEDTDIITSGAILHLTIKDDSVMPDYLTLVLNSIVVKMQAERDAGGSVIQHWKPSEIEKVVIPILDNEVQVQITEKVQESFALRKESVRLLELAKTAVEVAIEQGEDKAMELLTIK